MTRPGFGTDGVRGVANVELTPELVTALGRATARVLRPSALLVGRDTRRSGPMLQAALAAGVAAEGVDVVDLGVLPTAGVAFSAEHERVPAAMVSASHNPFYDNGIKLFDANGMKLSPEAEKEIEGELDRLLEAGVPPAERDRAVGWLGVDGEAVGRYSDHLVAAIGGRRLDGLVIALDCANGAASRVAPQVLGELGANVHVMSAEPDGTNINAACGSTQPGRLAEAVPQLGADLGLAFDGDADRLVAVDRTGAVLDGDVLLAIFAVDLRSRGMLEGDAVVVTVMTNLGFRLGMASRGIAVHETPVGDRHVLAALDSEGLALGGEQSGHIVFRRLATTGDGILTGILLADTVARAGADLASLAQGLVERVPQVLVNVAVARPERLAAADEVWRAVAAIESELGGTGRVLLRASGTEQIVRVMVEAATAAAATDAAGRLCQVVEGALGGG